MRQRILYTVLGVSVVLLIAQVGPGAFSRQEIQVGHGYQETVVGDGGIDMTRTGDILMDGDLTVDGDTIVQDIYLGGTIFGLEFPSGLPDPTVSLPSFVLYPLGGTEWVSRNAGDTRGALGFVDPILDKGSPGNIGMDTPGEVRMVRGAVHDNLVLYGDLTEGEILSIGSEYTPGSPPLALSGSAIGLSSGIGDDAANLIVAQGNFMVTGTPWLNRHFVEWYWDTYPDADPRVARSFSKLWRVGGGTGAGAGNTAEYERPYLYLPTHRGEVLIPSSRSEMVDNDWWPTAVLFGGTGVVIRDGKLPGGEDGHALTIGIKSFRTETDSSSDLVYDPDGAFEKPNDSRHPNFQSPSVLGILARWNISARDLSGTNQRDSKLVIRSVNGADPTSTDVLSLDSVTGDAEFAGDIEANNFPWPPDDSGGAGVYALVVQMDGSGGVVAITWIDISD